MPTDPAAVLHRLTERLAPLERSLQLASWAAATDARPETSAARQQAEEALLAVLADPELFAEVEAAAGGVRGAGDGDPLTSRALGKARLDLLARQIPADARAELVGLQAKVEAAFATVRGRVGGRELANSEIERVLASSDDARERQAAWEAGKQVGEVVADDVLALVELRNRVARGRGFRDWFAFSLATATSTRRGWTGSSTRWSWPPVRRPWPPPGGTWSSRCRDCAARRGARRQTGRARSTWPSPPSTTRATCSAS
jgi:Angiotensin-converting enzyme